MNKPFSRPRRLNQQFRQLAACVLIPLALATPVTAETILYDGVIAIVDDDVVLASDVEGRFQQIMKQIKKSGKQPPSQEEIKQNILNQLILESIQLQMARRAGVRINDEQLNHSMQRLAKQNGMTLLQFKEALENDGMSYNHSREQIRREMILQRVQQGNVNQRIQISDQEISNFLDSEEGQTLTAPEYRVRHALIPTSQGAEAITSSKASVYANSLYQKIKNGAKYTDVISKGGPYNITTSDLGWRKLEDLPSLLSSIVPKLQEGETAAPLQSPSGFHLVQLVDKHGDTEVIHQTRARHILLKASAIRDEAATEAAIKALRKKALDGEDFAKLARENSEDIGSAAEGGDLNWTSPGQLVPSFQQAMDKTEVEAFSPVFRSQYGWHFLQVQDRRKKDVTADLRRNMARNFIHKRKFDDELQVWLQKIRDEAYVDLK